MAIKYFLDTEFIEAFHKPLLGKRRHFIDLISIGIVCEDGREYCAISNEYDPKDAGGWVIEHVIIPMYQQTVHGDARNHVNALNFHKSFGKSNKQIAADIIDFCHHRRLRPVGDKVNPAANAYIYDDPIFYGYYCDYDWVLFCSLFGRMIDLPKGYPMYCRDLKQRFDEEFKEPIKSHPDYPIQKDEHNALADAKWNKRLHSFMEEYLSEII